MDNYYGFETSDEIKIDQLGFPLGKYKVLAKDEQGTATGLFVDFDIVTGEHKGTSAKVYYNTRSENEDVARIAAGDIRRIADATGKPVTPSTPIKGRAFVVEVIVNPKNERYTKVKYLPETTPVDDNSPAKNDIPFD